MSVLSHRFSTIASRGLTFVILHTCAVPNPAEMKWGLALAGTSWATVARL